MFWKKKSNAGDGDKVVIFFASDLHGSNVCFKKFVNAVQFYGANLLVMGGDMTGKAMVPIVGDSDGWEVTLQEQRHSLPTEEAVRAMEKRIGDRGYYPVRISRDELDAWASDPDLVDARFKSEILRAVERWMDVAEVRRIRTQYVERPPAPQPAAIEQEPG